MLYNSGKQTLIEFKEGKLYPTKFIEDKPYFNFSNCFSTVTKIPEWSVVGPNEVTRWME